MKKLQFRIIAASILFLLLIYVMINNRIGFSAPLFDETKEKFTLKPGDILVRPNLNWLPGSSTVASGRNFGHIAIVVQGAEGNTLEETLKKALVIEAVIFDQATRTFIFDKKKQMRKAPAVISFGKRFEGIRYRLRIDLSEQQQQQMINFLSEKVAKYSYNLFSIKNRIQSQDVPDSNNRAIYDESWNCATLTWYALLYTAGIDIDYNKGFWVYPNDLIRSPFFNAPGGRVRF